MAPHSDKMKLMRVVVREDFTKSRCDALISDFKLALQTLDSLDAKKIQGTRSKSAQISSRTQVTDFTGTNSLCVAARRCTSLLLSGACSRSTAMRSIVCRASMRRLTLFAEWSCGLRGGLRGCVDLVTTQNQVQLHK